MWYRNSIVMIFGIAIIYLIVYCVRGIIWGWAVKKIVENKGYNENWFWWGFFFGILALLMALTKPDMPKTTGGGSTNFEKASDVADRDNVSKNFGNENKITDTSGSAVKNVAGSAKFEICLKNNDAEGANKVFRNGMILLGCISIILGVAGVALCFAHGFMPGSIYFGLLGSREAFTVSLS